MGSREFFCIQWDGVQVDGEDLTLDECVRADELASKQWAIDLVPTSPVCARAFFTVCLEHAKIGNAGDIVGKLSVRELQEALFAKRVHDDGRVEKLQLSSLAWEPVDGPLGDTGSSGPT